MRKRSPPSSKGSSPSARRTTELRPNAPARAAIVERLRAAGCVFADDEAELLLTTAAPDELEQMVRQRVRGVPLEQILGWAEFGGLRVGVTPGVFVPRRRTELVLRQALMLAPPQPVVVELCCGSAALALALASALPQVELYVTDIDPAAVECARQNLAGLRGGLAGVLQGDLYEPLPHSLMGRVDLLLANAPYVPTGSIRLMPPEARLYESQVALDGGADGLDVLHRIIAGARRWLAPNGQLLVETGRGQASAVVAALECHEMAGRIVTSDELDATTVLGWLATADS